MYQNLKLTLFFLEDLGGMILIVSTKKNYQIIFFKKINIKKRGFGKYEYLDEKLYGNQSFAPGFQHTHEKNNTQKPDWVKHKYKYDNTK